MMLLWLFLFLLTVLIVHQFWWRRRSLPPGPCPMPLIGNNSYLHIREGECFRDPMQRIAAAYPRLCTFWFGPDPMIVINDYELIKEHIIKQGDKYAGRPHNALQEMMRNGRYGIVMTDGDQWKEQRRFSLHVLRDFGFGRNIMEERILIEIRHIIEDIQKESDDNNKEVDVAGPLERCIGNIVNAVLFGKRFSTREKVHEIKLSLDKINKVSDNPLGFLLFFEWTRKVPLLSGVWKNFNEMMVTIGNFFDKQFEEHSRAFDPEAEADSFVSAYLKEIHNRKKKLNHQGYFSDAQLKGTIFDIWLAGLQTTLDTLHWSFLYMIQYPEVQRLRDIVKSLKNQDADERRLQQEERRDEEARQREEKEEERRREELNLQQLQRDAQKLADDTARAAEDLKQQLRDLGNWEQSFRAWADLVKNCS